MELKLKNSLNPVVDDDYDDDKFRRSLFPLNHSKIISVQFQDISCISFCYVVFCGKENNENILLRNKSKK